MSLHFPALDRSISPAFPCISFEFPLHFPVLFPFISHARPLHFQSYISRRFRSFPPDCLSFPFVSPSFPVISLLHLHFPFTFIPPSFPFQFPSHFPLISFQFRSCPLHVLAFPCTSLFDVRFMSPLLSAFPLHVPHFPLFPPNFPSVLPMHCFAFPHMSPVLTLHFRFTSLHCSFMPRCFFRRPRILQDMVVFNVFVLRFSRFSARGGGISQPAESRQGDLSLRPVFFSTPALGRLF